MFYDYEGRPKKYAPVRFQEWSPEGHPRFFYALNPMRNEERLIGQALADHLALIDTMKKV